MKQLSIFLENKKGKLLQITDLLKDNNINIKAITIAETEDFGIVRMIVDKIDEAILALKENNIACSETEVIAAEVDDKPGELSNILHILNDVKINVEYMYSFLDKKENFAIMVFKVKDNNKAITALISKGIKLYKEN